MNHQLSSRRLFLYLTLIAAALVTVLPLLAAPQTSTALAGAAAQSAAQPVIFLKDGDIWTWNGSTLNQLSTWGYNERPVISPDGSRIAYNSWAQITVNAINAGQPVFGFIPSNIWVMNPVTGEAFRAADQPANAVYFQEGVPDRVVMRGTPAWSPDGSQLAWVELLSPEYRYQLVVYTLATGQISVIVPSLPLPYADGGFIPIHTPQWSSAGIAITNGAVSGPEFSFEDRLYIYGPQGVLLSETVIGSSTSEYAFHSAWTSYNGQMYYGAIYPSGKRYLVQPATGQLIDMPALPEMYSTLAPTNSVTVFTAPNTINSALTGVWTAVYANRQQDQLLNYTGDPRNIALSPDGQRIAYYADALTIWQNGQVIGAAPGTGIGSGSPYDLAVVWGPTAWRVRTDWPGGSVTCNLPSRLTVGSTGQVTPGLPNVLRSLPQRGPQSAILGELPAGAVFTVLEGPACGPEGRNWFRVNYQGLTGWTPEGEGSVYWLQPYSASPPPVGCTLPPRLAVGSVGYVLPGLPNLVRSQPRTGSDSVVVGRMPGGAFFNVIGGPQCGPEGRHWYQVQYSGIIGWTAEGEYGSYWVAPFGCPASPTPRLVPNTQAAVTPGDPNRLRTGPGTNYPEITLIPGGGIFSVIGGPQCGPEGWTYWRVNYNGVIGWTAEGDGGTYWLEPLTVSPPLSCTLPTRLTPGMTGRVIPGPDNVLRSAPGTGANSAIIGELPGGQVFSVLAGPVCGNDGRMWFQVQAPQGVGWTAEGDGGTYWLEPL